MTPLLFPVMEKQMETLTELTKQSFKPKCEFCGTIIEDEGYIIMGDKNICTVCMDRKE